MLPYYKILAAPNLPQISAEINTYLRATCPLYVSMYDTDTSSFGLISNADGYDYRFLRNVINLKNACPTFADWLDSKEITSRNISMIGWFVAGSNGNMPIHVDDVDAFGAFGAFGESINLPLLNFGNSYTAWYSATKLDSKLTSSKFFNSSEFTKKVGTNITAYDESSAVELARVSVAQAMYLNVTIPHRAINLGSRPRSSLSVRFRRKLNLDKIC